MPRENYDDTTHSPTVSCNSVRLTMHPPKLIRSYRTPGPAWSGQQYLSLFLTCCTPCSMTVVCKCFTLPVESLLVAIRPTCLQFRMSNVCAAVRLNERQKGRERGDDSEGGHMDGPGLASETLVSFVPERSVPLTSSSLPSCHRVSLHTV